ncbi:MAG: hypothetical protein U0441_18520 [Polyangiaceae bacterium]
MEQSLHLDTMISGARVRPLHAFVGALAAALTLFSAAGCETAESTGAAADADQGDTCHGAISSYEWITRIGPTQDNVEGQCVPLDLTWDQHFEVPCLIIEGRSVGAAEAGSCNACTGAGRVPVNPYSQPLVELMKSENPDADLDCFCAVEQIVPDIAATPNDLKCQMDPSDALVDMYGKPIDGFCYLDPHRGLGDAALTENCPQDAQRLLRFVGAGAPVPGSTTYVACVDYEYGSAPASCQ